MKTQKKYYQTVLQCFLFSFLGISTCAAQVKVVVDIEKDVHPISPYIYGINGKADSTFSAVRFGGNRVTGYNWENNCSNAGADNSNASDLYLAQGIPTLQQEVPGVVVTDFAKKAKRQKQFISVTLPMAGFVAADSKGVVSSSEKAPSDRWKYVIPEKKAPFSLQPDLTDTVIYVDEELNSIISSLGKADKGGVNAYYLDNEPDFWQKKHPRISPGVPKISPFLEKSIVWANMIKRMDPHAKVIGPAAANLEGMYGFALSSGFLQSGYRYFIDLYLDSMRQASVKSGKRLLDVFDFHWYPDNIVSYKFDGVDPITAVAIEERLQAPRALWDSVYSDARYKNLNLIGFMKKSIDKFYPGTGIAFTEYQYGAENHYSGGLALADVLGVFGREGVYLATKWYINDANLTYKYGQLAYDLFRNYDSKHSRFGDVSVSALISTPEERARISSVASVDNAGKLHVITINKSSTEDSILLSFASGVYKNAQVWGFGEESDVMVQKDSIKNIELKRELLIKLPKHSASHFIFEPVNQSTIISAFTSADSSVLLLKPSVNLPLANSINTSKIKVFDGSSLLNVNSIRYSVDSGLFVVLLDAKYSGKSVLSLKIEEGFFVDNSQIPSKQQSIDVKNLLLTASPVLLSAQTIRNGYEIVMQFSKNIANIQANSSLLSVQVKKASISIQSVSINGDKVSLKFDKRFCASDSIVVSTNGASLKAEDGSSLSVLTMIHNSSPQMSPQIVSTAIVDGGYSLNIKFDQWLDNRVSSGFTLLKNNVSVGSFTLNDDVLSVRLLEKIEFGDELQFSYDTAAHVRSYQGGVLDPIVKYSIANTIQKPGYLAIPAKIEAELYYYKTDAILNNASLDVVDLVKTRDMYGIVPGQKIGYAIDVPASSDYFCTFRYSTILSGSFKVKIDNICIDTVVFKGGSASWYTLGTLLTLPEGKHELELDPISGLISLNWVKFRLADSVTIVRNAIIKTTNRINLTFEIPFASLPDKSAFTFTDETGNLLQIQDILFGSNKTDLYFVFSDLSTVRSVYVSIDEKKVEFEEKLPLSKVVNKQIYTTGFSENELFFDVSYANGSISFHSTDAVLLTNVSVQIVTLTGQLCYSKEYVDGNEPLVLNLPQGLFIAHITLGGSKITKRIVVN